MNFKNANIYTEDFRFVTGGFSVEDGKFCDVLIEKVDAVDLNGAYVIPGLIDVHNHGNSNADFSDGSYEGDVKMARYLAGVGVTSFAPATMTLPYAVIARALEAGLRLRKAPVTGCARLLGVQMEGPFFSEKKKGAQNGEYLRLPDFAAFRKLYEDSEGLIAIVDLAPELEGSVEFVEQAKQLCTVSIAHTDSDYEHARAAIQAGVTHLTHLYNAMPPIHHRKPGVIGAASENEAVSAEIICDGIHVHPSSVRMAFKLFGAERMVLISDALRCCGMPDGEYELGGQQVFLAENVARLADGTIAGSATNLFDCMRNAIRFGIPKEDAVRAATWNPARQIHALDRVGSIANGKLADFVICGKDFTRREVWLGGEKIEA
ncbi:MAG: N-acetylglucosamine-6-phosphate deacetylase [Oscillospiraceae bacterium]|nr:N-acetylglucosamine-6-phosphate deacetylase [Oscillospiraceae bacterium]